MNFEQFRSWAHKAADWAADYMGGVRARPVRAQVSPGDIARQLPAAPPVLPEEMEHIFADFERIIMPGMTHWQHPRFFAYFPANASPPSIIAEYLTATLAAQCMLWQTSPAATELETRVLDWLRQMLGLPDGFSGVIQDSASSATLAAVLTGREKALQWRGNMKGLAALPATRVYASSHVHTSIDRAVWIAGIGQDNLVRIATGDDLAMDPAALEAAILADKAAGLLPATVIASLGGTSVGATDNISAICTIARKHGLYVHVDAAWAGSAMICPEFRYLMEGSAEADSFVFNPHKWLLTNFDCCAHFVRNPDDLVKTLAIQPDYLKTHGHDGLINYSEWTVPLGRRFRALKLWFVIRAYGVENLQQIIRNHVGWARELAGLIDAADEFELVSQPMLSLFSFRFAPQGARDLDELNQRLLTAINDDGRIYLTQTRYDGKYVIRFQVGQTHVTRDDVMFAWTVIKEIAATL